jgi:hypothetical protein
MSRSKKIIQIEHFDARFIELTSEHTTYQEAYEALEEEYSKLFGIRRYKNYESFRISRLRRLQRIMN